MFLPRVISSATGGLDSDSSSLISSNSKYFGHASGIRLCFYKLPEVKLFQTLCKKDESFKILRLSPVNLVQAFIVTDNNISIFYNIETNENVTFESPRRNLTPLQAEFTSDGKFILMTYKSSDFVSVYNALDYSSDHYERHLISGCSMFMPIPNDPEKILFISEQSELMIGNISTGDVISGSIFTTPYDIKFDPLDPSNCLLITEKSKWGYVNITNKAQIVMVCERDDIEMVSGDWIQAIPGYIMTGDKKHGILYVWSVSSGDLIETIEIGEAGISTVYSISGKDLVIAFSSGSIGVYDIISKKFTLKVPKMHVGTMFSGIFIPSDASVFATAGSDGRVCFWNVPDLTHKSVISVPDQNGSLVCISFSLGGGYLAAGLSSGEMSVISMEVGNSIIKTKLHSKHVFCIEWSHFDNHILASAGRDSLCCVYDVHKKKTILKISTKSEFRKLQWSPRDRGSLVVACADGSIYIRFDGGCYSTIKGGKYALYDVKWSPFHKNLIASTDDGGHVLLFNTETKSVKIKKGHSSPARPVVWSNIKEDLLISGGYDGYVCFWNIEQMNILLRVQMHSSHIYGISAHPNHPYLYVSVSKDCTIRMWSIDKVFPEYKLNEMISCKTYIARKFCPFLGASQLEKLLRRITKDGTKVTFNDNDLIHVNDVLRIEKKRVQRALHQIPRTSDQIMRGKGSRKRAMETAEAALFSGDPKKYCELMFLCGEYDMALAVAPCVSYQFWQSLTLARAKLLDDSPNIANYSLIAGLPRKAISEYIEFGSFDKALVVAAAMRERTFQPKTKTKSRIKKHVANRFDFVKREFNGEDFYIYSVASKRSHMYAQNKEPLLSAASLLTVGDVQGAIWRLIHSGEILWAVDVARITGFFDEAIACVFLRYCISLGKGKEAFSILSSTLKRIFAPLIVFVSLKEREEFYLKNDMKTLSEFLSDSNRLKGPLSCLYKMLAGHVHEALSLAISLIDSILKSNNSNWNEALEIAKVVRLSAPNYNERTGKNEAVAISHFFAIYEAMWKGYSLIAEGLYKSFEAAVKLVNIDWLSERLHDAQVATAFSICQESPYKANKFLKEKNIHIIEFDEKTKSTGGITVKALSSNVVPIDLDTKPQYSYISGKHVSGNFFFLEDKTSKISIEEAIMWFEVTPFSPLPTAAVLYPN